MAEEQVVQSENATQTPSPVAVPPKKIRFSGTGYHSIDDKNRIKFPSEIRPQIGDTPFRLAKGNNRAVYVYTEEEAEKILARAEERLMDESLDLRVAKQIRRYVASFTNVVEVDGQGRFLLPQMFMNWAGFEKKEQIVTIGFLNHFEIWKAADWDKEDDDDDDDVTFEQALAYIKER